MTTATASSQPSTTKSSSQDAGKPLAVVTGGSNGIGLELAKQFASHDFDLIVAAEPEGLDDAAEQLRGISDAQVTTVATDLSTYDGVEELYGRIRATGRPVEALALHAGIGVGGDFTETDLDIELKLIELNISAVVHLAKRLLPEMKERGSGRVLITSSIAATQPSPYEAVYAASKSFTQSYAEALREELRGTGVTVTALMPGPTETNFFNRAGMLDTKIGASSKDDPALVAKQGFESLMSGEQKKFAGGLVSKALGISGAFVPDSVKAYGHKLLARPGSAG
jgi:short-subunit dehydrogenase